VRSKEAARRLLAGEEGEGGGVRASGFCRIVWEKKEVPASFLRFLSKGKGEDPSPMKREKALDHSISHADRREKGEIRS